MFITKQVAHLEIADGMWHITFETSPISYTYRYERIKFFTKVERIDIETRGFYLKNKRIEDIRELYRLPHDTRRMRRRHLEIPQPTGCGNRTRNGRHR